MLELTTQSGLEEIHRFPRGGRAHLGADQPAVDVQVGLRDHRRFDCGIVVPAQPHPGGEDRTMRHPAQLGDFSAGVVGGAG